MRGGELKCFRHTEYRPSDEASSRGAFAFVFSLYSQLRCRGVPVFLELWSGIDGVEYFTLSHHPSMPPPPPPVIKRRRRSRRRRRTTTAPPVEPSNRSDTLLPLSHGRCSYVRPPGEIETPQRPPEEFQTSQLSIGEVSKAKRPPGIVQTPRCSLEEVEAETPLVRRPLQKLHPVVDMCPGRYTFHCPLLTSPS